MEKEIINSLEETAKAIRRSIVTMLGEAGSGHPGGSLSSTDVLTALYFHEMKLDPGNPQWDKRDRFVLSKGHAAPLLYATLAQRGYFPKEELMTLRKMGSRLQGHPVMDKVPGVELSTGSLGQGISMAVGLALAGRLDGSSHRVFALVGDGECQEGIVWEAAMAAAHYGLGNLTAVLDANGLQIDGRCSDVMCLDPIEEKWRAFGWHVMTIDGHDMQAIVNALQEADKVEHQPVMIVAHTVKGKGVSFMENQPGWHGKAPNPEQVQQALEELA